MMYEVMTYARLIDTLEQNLLFLKLYCLNHFPMFYGPLVELYQFYFRYKIEEINCAAAIFRCTQENDFAESEINIRIICYT